MQGKVIVFARSGSVIIQKGGESAVMKKFILSVCCIIILVLLVAVSSLWWASRGKLSEAQYANGAIFELPSSPDTPPRDRYTIVSYNIGYCSGLTNNSGFNATEAEYSQNVQTILGALKKISPDIVAMQEVDFSSARSYNQDQSLLVAEGLGLRYRANAYTWDKHYVPWPYWPPSHNFGRILSGQSVASRFPVVKQTKTTFPAPEENPFWYNLFYLDRIVQVVELDVASRPLVVINIHFEAYKRKTRESQGAALAQMIRDYMDRPLILLGDFNARPPWQTNEPTLASILSVEGLRKEFPEEAYQSGNETRLYTSSSGNPRSSIDHIFYNDKIKCLSARVLQDAGTGSDHLPVMMEFTFN